MKTLLALLLAATLTSGSAFAQGRGHAYGHEKHEEQEEHQRVAPEQVYTYTPRTYTYTTPRTYTYTYPRTYTYTTPRTYTYSYGTRPAWAPYPNGYQSYQQYGSYYYPNTRTYSYTTRTYRTRRYRRTGIANARYHGGVAHAYGRMAQGRRER